MQQDADEFYGAITQVVSGSLSSFRGNSRSTFDSILGFEIEEERRCLECELEPVVYSRERVNKLVCNIQGAGPGSQKGTDFLSEGLSLYLNGSLEKNSQMLGRNALWSVKKKISKLSPYICIQFMRFFWKENPEATGDAPRGTKCKILRKVLYPETLDIADFCSDNLRSGLLSNRREEKEGKKLEQPAESSSMEVEGGGEANTKSEVSFGEGIPSSCKGYYELHSLVSHKGRSADSGHYIGWVRDQPGSDVWWKFDDDKVTMVPNGTEDILALSGGGDSDMCYLSFYRFRN